ncbi:MAG TPA: glycosyltransferase [Gemmatimonadaceae bacterium]|nr:glycosyltransferase [Gemmatimonadaceae bacterium]
MTEPATVRPTFSVIIPTFRRHAQISACLGALARLRYPRDRFEVIVVDDGSGSPPSKEVARAADSLRVRLVRSRHGGPGWARNAGAAVADGEFLAFTDDDCTPETDWLDALSASLVKMPDAAVGGRTENGLPDNPYSTASQLLVSYLYEYYSQPDHHNRRFFTTNNLALSRAIFTELGGFDVGTPGETAEDRDLCARWAHSGRPLHYCADAVVYHAHELGPLSFLRQHYRYGRSALYVERARAQRANERVRLEPLEFYFGMLAYPFANGHRGRAMLLSLLIAATQAAYAHGVLAQLVGDALGASRKRAEQPRTLLDFKGQEET